MNPTYRTFFAMQREPFAADIALKNILVTAALQAVQERIQYAIRLGATALLTGEIGSGKSTALRYVTDNLHPSQYRLIRVTATSGSILELYRQILQELATDTSGCSRARMTARIKDEVVQLACGKKITPVLVIDEASLLRLEVFAELHTLTQFESDSKPYLPMVLAGQNNLVDNLRYRSCLPLASRVVCKSHLQGVDRNGMQQYLEHHLGIAGVKQQLFEDAAVTAIHQGSGGLFRKANHLARGAIVAAAKQQSASVTAEYVRLAATEIF
jgi:type II secretory pathway predicted ATPase ExeA